MPKAMADHMPALPPLPASIEMTPRQVLDIDDLAYLFPAGTAVYLTDLGTDPDALIVAAATALAGAGYIAVPHIAARRIASQASIEQRLAMLTGSAGVTDVLVIAGGASDQAGPFASSMEFLNTGVLEAHGIIRIGVAGHPEGSPDISEKAIAEALTAKNAYAETSPASLRLVTQFGFDTQRVIAWEQALRASDNRLPVHIGIAGPAKVTTLIKYASLCGVGASLAFLKKRAGALAMLATSYSPEAVAEPLEAHAAADIDCLIEQLHVFPFGGVRKASEWLVERGSWTWETAGEASWTEALS